MAPSRTSFSIAELAEEFDITPRAIRFYEDVGLLEPARAGRNRVYSQRDRTRLKLTLRGKRLGLSLQEIKQLVDMYDSPSDTRQQLHAFLAVLAEHRRLLEQLGQEERTHLQSLLQLGSGPAGLGGLGERRLALLRGERGGLGHGATIDEPLAGQITTGRRPPGRQRPVREPRRG